MSPPEVRIHLNSVDLEDTDAMTSMEGGDNDEQRAYCRRHTDIMTVPTITPAIAGGYRIRENNSGDLFKELGGDEMSRF
jgi:hypothetical protein